MNTSARRLVTAGVFALALMVALLWLFRHPLKVQYHIWRLRYAERHMVAPGPSNQLDALVAFLVGRRTSADWSSLRDRQEEALIRMGYFARWEFPFTNQHVTAGQLVRKARDGFGTHFSSVTVITNGQPLLGATVATNSFARIVAPVKEMRDWSALVSTVDREAD